MPEVERVVFESKEEAYERFKEQFKDTPEIVENTSPDVLPESFRVKLKDPTKYRVLQTAFSGRPGVQEVQDQRNLLENLFNLLNGMNIAALFVMGLMLVVALLLFVVFPRVEPLLPFNDVTTG